MILGKKRKWLWVTMLTGLMLVGLTGCGQVKHHGVTEVTNRKIRIVTTTDFYGEAARAVAGDKGTVTSVINRPSVDPHDYEPTTKVASEVSKADVLVANGIGYDTWMNKLAQNNHQGTYIKVGETVMGKKVGDNPHIWYDPTTMPKYARYLAKKLGQVQPQNRAYFKRNAEHYVQSLKPVTQQVAQLKADAKSQTTRQVDVSEPVFDYALAALGYKVANPSFEEAVEKGTDPSPKSIRQMQTAIKQRQIAFFVDNKQVSDRTVKNMVRLAKQHDVPVLKVTETLPAHMTYKQWMLSQYQQLAKILRSAE